MTWRAYGASVRGTGHVRLGLPCQDAHGWRPLPGGIACAVADGLGSAPRAEEGARRAVAAVLDALTTSLPRAWGTPDPAAIEGAVRAAFASARAALVEATGEAPPRDYATTLLVGIATRRWTAVGQIGDGALVGRWPDGRLETLSLPQRGEYANDTTPLTAEDALERLRLAVWPAPLQALALFSDGLQALALDLASGEPFEPFFGPFFEALAEPFDPTTTGERLAAFLDTPRVCARTDDDKTLMVAGTAASL